MTKTNRSYLKKVLKNFVGFLNIILIFGWAFWNTSVLADGNYVDPGDQLQYGCVAAGIVAVGYILASMMRKGSMARFWTVMSANFMAAPAFLTMVIVNGGMDDFVNCAVTAIPFAILGIAAPYIAFLVLEE